MVVTKDYVEGYFDGIWMFAYMKDGIYYVGTTGKTLAEAKRNFIRDHEVFMTEEAKLWIKEKHPTSL